MNEMERIERMVREVESASLREAADYLRIAADCVDAGVPPRVARELFLVERTIACERLGTDPEDTTTPLEYARSQVRQAASYATPWLRILEGPKQ